MDEHQKSRLQDELGSLFGPRRFLAAGSDDEGLGTASPQTAAELQQLARLTRDSKVPIIPRAATSSPFARASDGLVISFDYLSKIYSINTRSSLVTVEPGVIWHTLIEHLASRGLMLRVYPSSEGFSTAPRPESR